VAVKIYRSSPNTMSTFGTVDGTARPQYVVKNFRSAENSRDYEYKNCAVKGSYHRNIVPLLAAYHHGNCYTIVYSLADTSLDRLMRMSCSMSISEIARNMADISSALAWMHAGQQDRFGYHSDIK